MKLKQTNAQGEAVSSNLVNSDDIFIGTESNSHAGEKLADVLDTQDKDIQKLKSNVKWLYKYGGVGGSGGTGSFSTKTKATFRISYTDFNGVTQTDTIHSQSNFLVEQGTQVTVTCTITSLKSLNSYGFEVAGKKASIQASEGSTASLTFIANNNATYTALVNGETAVSMEFNIYTEVIKLTHDLQTSEGSTIENGQPIYQSYIENNQSLTYKVALNNELPSVYPNVQLKEVFWNGKVKTLQITDNAVSVSISKSDLENFGIYKATIVYTIDGKTDITVEDEWVYKDNNVFIYCFSKNDDLPVYLNASNNPTYYTGYQILYYFRIYGGRNDNLNTTYNITLKTGDNTSGYKSCKSGIDYTCALNNTVTKNTQIVITATYSTGGAEYRNIYYMYLGKPEENSFLFANNGRYYYHAIYEDSISPNKFVFNDLSKITDTQVFSQDTTYTLGQAENLKSYSTEVCSKSSVYEFITDGKDTQRNSYSADAILSFGIKYSGYDTTLPLLTITSGTNTFTLYKNKYVVNTDESTDLCIPNDNSYHLVSLYFKSRYTISPDDYDSNNTNGAIAIFIDGIVEAVKKNVDFPISIASDAVGNDASKVTFNSSNCIYDYIGCALFNNYENNYLSSASHIVKRYLLDFDPIIPVQWYQAYQRQFNLASEIKNIDVSIYQNLSINHTVYHEDSDGQSQYLSKFVEWTPEMAASFTNLPVYCIIPDQANLNWDSVTDDGSSHNKINSFLYQTTKGFGENDGLGKVTCAFRRYDRTTNSLKDIIDDSSVKYTLSFQGSSTLLYAVKNFQISAKYYNETTKADTEVYFTPDQDKFPKMENAFNLKADMVDSSTSNNVVIGNFVQDIMTSPFNTESITYRAALTGEPVLLFAGNKLDSSENYTVNQYFFLGIYNLNLGRMSTNNLGYTILEDSTGNEITGTKSSNFSDVLYHKVDTNDKLAIPNNFQVAEVQGNGFTYDFSQYDRILLRDNMFGDFYSGDSSNDKLITTANQSFEYPIKELAAWVNKYVKWDGSTKAGLYNFYDYATALNKDSYAYTRTSTDEDFYYYNDKGECTKISSDNPLFVQANNNVSYAGAYRNLDESNISLVSNPTQQFHIVVDINGKAITRDGSMLYYVEKDCNPITDREDSDGNYIPIFDVNATLQYYMICMALGMVDSVQKNLTIKCARYNSKNLSQTTWYPAFYDMDTAFGLSNSGSAIDSRAFSDYVGSENIYTDYAPETTEENTALSGWYDIPSSALFLYAKYYKTLCDRSNTNINTPYEFWCALRGSNGLLASARAFCSKYIDNYFAASNPLIWNLNYFYKYLSAVGTTDSLQGDFSKFHGTRKFAREEWLDSRFHFLDALFGIKTENRTIGHSTYKLSESQKTIDNTDVVIQNEMFPAFTKGVSPNNISNIKLTGTAKQIALYRIDTNTVKVCIINDDGTYNLTADSSKSNTDIGFYGTQTLTGITNCKDFLINTNNENTIVNNYIKEITISNLTNNSGTIKLELDNLSSVTTISIRNSKFNKLIVSGNNQSSKTLPELVVDAYSAISEVQISNCTITTLKLLGKISKINLQNVAAALSLPTQLLTLTSLELNTFQENTSTNYSYSNAIKLSSLIIKNSSIHSLTINNSSNLTTINFDNVAATKINIANCGKVASVTLKDLNLQTLQLNSTSVSNTKIESISITGKVANLCLPNFQKVNTLSLPGSQDIILMSNCFYQWQALQQLPDLNNDYKYILAGSRIFYKCTSLFTSGFTAPNWEFSDSVSDFTGLFMNCNMPFNCITTILNSLTVKKDNSNLTNLFAFQISEDSVVCSETDGQLSFDTDSFDKSFEHFINKKSSLTLKQMFFATPLNIVSKSMFEVLKRYTTSSNVFISAYTDSSIIYLPETFLGNFVTYTGCNFGSLYGDCSFKMYNISTEKISDMNMTTIFGTDSKITYLDSFSPYSDSSRLVDFNEGLPGTIKEITYFGLYLQLYAKNIEQIFKNFANQSCVISDSFLSYAINNYTAEKTTGEVVNLKTMLLDENNKARVTIEQLSHKQKVSTFNVAKTCTADEFKTILQEYKNAPGLFRNCTVTGYKMPEDNRCDLLDDQLINCNYLDQAFVDFKVVDVNSKQVPLSLKKAWGTDTANKTSGTYMYMAFSGCYLEPFEEALNLVDITDMSYCFYNCTFNYTNTKVISTAKNIQSFAIPLTSDGSYAPILPMDFWDILSINSTYDISYCFARKGFDSTALCGTLNIIDEKGNYPWSKYLGEQVFANCNIVPYQKETETEEEENTLVLFPKWFDSFKSYNVFVNAQKDGPVYLFDNYIPNIQTYSIPNVPPVTFAYKSYYYYLFQGDTPNVPFDENGKAIYQFKWNTNSKLQIDSTSISKSFIPYRFSFFLAENTEFTDANDNNIPIYETYIEYQNEYPSGEKDDHDNLLLHGLFASISDNIIKDAYRPAN